MSYTVSELSKLSGVTVRTLHWYDEIGLLHPAYTTGSDSRHYEEKIEDLLEETSSAYVERFCRRLLKDLPRFRVYLRSRNHPMTNNPAEEALRPLVIAQKLCFGNTSEYGRAWRSAIQSCVETFRKQGRNAWDLLTDAIRADRLGLPSPTL